MTPTDVIVPVFNREATVAEASLSVLDGVRQAVMEVVVDGGLTDRTAEIVRGMADADGRVRYIKQDNGGTAAALQRAFQATMSRYVSQPDPDEISELDGFLRLLAFLERRSDCVAVSGADRRIDVQGCRTGHVAHSPIEADSHWLSGREPSQRPLDLLCRSVLAAVGDYRPFIHGEDVDLRRRLLKTGELHNSDEIIASHRFHASSTGSTSVDTLMLAVRAPSPIRCRPQQRSQGRVSRGAVPSRHVQGRRPRLLLWETAAAVRLGRIQDARLARGLTAPPGRWRWCLHSADCEAGRDLGRANIAETRHTEFVRADRLVVVGDLRRAARLAPVDFPPTAVARAALRRL